MAFLGIEARDTIGSVLDRHKGVGPGFDLLRVLLAVSIVYYHTFQISGAPGGLIASFGADPSQVIRTLHTSALNAANTGQGGFVGISRPFHVGLVPAFFALSGLLVIGSAFRLRRVSTFLAFRFFRIFPALIVEVTLSALVIGPIFTTLPASDYFSSPIFYRYFGNIIGWVTFELPSVFVDNPWQSVVNANLWTLPSEFDCYFLIALLMATRLIYNRTLFSLVYLAAYVAFSILNGFTQFAASTGNMPSMAITFYFFTGVFVYHWRDHIPLRPILGVIAAAIVIVGLRTSHCHFLVAPFLTYLVAFFGLSEVPRIKLIASGDYSYGIYLYAFPIAQALLALFPGAFVARGAILTIATMIATSLFAAFSWHVIEKPALRQKRHLPDRWFPVARRIIPQTPQGRLDADPEAPAPRTPA